MNLYDYIYVDIEKVVSLYSQLTGGVVEIRETHNEKSSVYDNKRNYDFKVFKHDAGGSSQEKEVYKDIIKPHHSLLQELEEELSSSGFLMDLADLPDGKTLKDSHVRKNLKGALCVKCTGRVVIEDYERLKEINQNYPAIVELINRSASESIKKTTEYQKIENEIKTLKSATGKNKAEAKRKIAVLEQEVETILEQARPIKGAPEWILDGMKTWIDAFLPNIINVRVYPSQLDMDEHIFGHLNSSNFIIRDSNAFHFTYGSFPTEELTMIGIITSVPDDGEEKFNPLEEFHMQELNDKKKVEKAYRGVFRGFDGFEAMIRTSRYPRVLVHPILVYRETLPNKELMKKDR